MRRTNPLLRAVQSPPIAQAESWLQPPEAFADKPLLNLAQGVPSYAPAEELREAMACAALDPDNAGYTAICGLPELRDAFASHMNRVYGSQLSYDQVAITAGCNQAFCATLQALAGPGDQVLLSSPYYFNHHMWLTMQGIEPVLSPCNRDDGLPSVEATGQLIGQRTKALVLVSPNNPTGAIYSPELLAEFLDLAARFDIALVLDETYKDFLPGGTRPHKLFSASRWERNLISLHSFSKSYSMTGARVGAIVAANRVLDQVEKVLDTVTICPSHISQCGALHALQHLDTWRDARTTELVARADALRDAFKRNDLGYRLASAGGFFAYVQHPFTDQTAEAVAKRLAVEQNLLCLPGSMFGPDQELFLRFSFTNVTPAWFPALMDRLLASETA